VLVLGRVALHLRRTWLAVLKKALRCYKVSATSSLIGHIYRGKVQLMVNAHEPIASQFFLDTDKRERESEKHSFDYNQSLLRTISKQVATLSILMREEEALTPAQWEGCLRDITGLIR
jgi:hypothetical protein